jgi:cell division septal protein FtsQ
MSDHHDTEFPYAKGDTVQVYYNPSHPEESTLSAPMSKEKAKYMVIGGVLLLIFAWIMVWAVFKYESLAMILGAKDIIGGR